MTLQGGWRLGYRPGLDGLRGVAVLAVFVYHGIVLATGEAAAAPSLGVVGVGIFFTLSGFLITCLLLDEREDAGKVDLLQFYLRRALRLFPAVSVVVILTLLVSVVLDGFVTFGSAISTLFYVQNWFTVLHWGEHDALEHTWSLAIEEQFYLVWPLILIMAFRLGRSLGVFAVAIVGAAASTVWRNSIWGSVDAWRVYAGTDTRADGLLIGCALAVLVRMSKQPLVRPRVALAVGGALLLATTQFDDRAYHVLAPLTTSIGTALVVTAAVATDRTALNEDWLRWFGARSYGLYIWHIPVLYALRRGDLQTSSRILVYVVASLLFTVLSWRYVEKPFLARKRWRMPEDPGRSASRFSP